MPAATPTLLPQHETLFGPEHQQLPYEVMHAYGVTPEQMSMMTPEQMELMMNGYGQMQMEQSALSLETQLQSLEHGTLLQTEAAVKESAREAEHTLASIFENSLESSGKETAAIRAVEDLSHDERVRQGQNHVNEIFAGIMSQPAVEELKQHALKTAITNEHMIVRNVPEVVDEASHGKEVMQDKTPEPYIPAGERVMVDGKLVKSTSEVVSDSHDAAKDVRGRNNGMTSRLVRNMTTRLDGTMQKLGVKNRIGNFRKRQNMVAVQMAPEAAMVNKAHGAKELDVTQNARERWTEDRIVGEDFVRAFATGNRMNSKQKKEVVEKLRQDPSAAREVGMAVARLRSTGEISRRTSHKVGKLLRQVV